MGKGGLFTPFVSPYNIGTFLSRTGAIVTGTPFDNKIEPMPSSGGDARIYANHKADVITSSNDRQTTASLSTSAEVSGWGVQASASGSFVQNSGMTGQAVTLIIDSTTAVKAYVEKNLNSLKLNKNAKGYLSDLIKESDSKATNQREHVLSMFEQRYGAYVVDSITYNAQFTACYQFESRSQSQSRQIASSIQLFAEDLNAGGQASASHSINSASSQSNMRCAIYKMGEPRCSGFPDFTTEDIINEWRTYNTENTSKGSCKDVSGPTHLGTPFTCTLRRMRDVTCVRAMLDAADSLHEEDTDDTNTNAPMSDAQRADFIENYNLVATVLQSLSPSSKVGCQARVIIGPYLAKYQDLPLRKDVENAKTEYKALVRDLEKMNISVEALPKVDPIKANTTYLFKCLGCGNRTYTILLQSVDTSKFSSTNLPDATMAGCYFRLMRLKAGGADYLDGGNGGYWSDVKGYPDSRLDTDTYLFWQLIPMPGGAFLVRCMSGTLNPTAKGPVMLNGANADHPGGYSYTSADVENFLWELTPV